MALSEAKKRGNKKWDDANLKRISLAMSKELYSKFEKCCADNGHSKNGLINEIIKEYLDRNGYL